MIALVDCNAFFCSCELIFAPEYKNKPVVVLSNNDGCALARTDEAKALGIKMAQPYFEFKHFEKTHGLKTFSSNFALYINISDRVMNLLEKMSPDIAVYSVDEAFLDLKGMPNVEKFAYEVKDKILNHIGIPVGVGIGPTKVLAKAANFLAKTSKKAKGVVNLMSRKHQDVALERIEILEIWGIGRATAAKLKAMGIKTAKDLRDYSNEKLLQKIFGKTILQIKNELMGIQCFPFHKAEAAKKEIMCSRTFAKSVYDIEVLKESVATYVTDAAEKMRSQGSLCSEISVFARSNPHNELEQGSLYESERLRNPTANTLKLIKHALALTEKGYQLGHEYKKVGVKLGQFSQGTDYQVDFLSPQDTPEEHELMAVLDHINYYEGDQTIKSAACGTTDNAWRMNRNFKSPRYTTSWNELKKFN
ncbi:MAG: Y-family DNA polymerase [Bacteriovoracaceae bacterium]|nr:Y-family DNA polymerase [Bacteriovoracaceae bacterium]